MKPVAFGQVHFGEQGAHGHAFEGDRDADRRFAVCCGIFAMSESVSEAPAATPCKRSAGSSAASGRHETDKHAAKTAGEPRVCQPGS